MSFDSQRNDWDNSVERVLARLRETRVPEGLEQRVLGAVRSREAEGVHGGVRGWVWAAATVVLVCAVTGAVMWRGRRVEVAGAAPRVVAPQGLVQGPGVAVMPVKREAPRVVAARARGAVRVRPVMPEIEAEAATEAAIVEPVIAEGRVPAATREVDAEARAEARAPSRVAPPEPLTVEERRLMRVATQGTAEQKAALNPVVRERQYEAAKRAVMEFFEPPKSAEAVQE